MAFFSSRRQPEEGPERDEKSQAQRPPISQPIGFETVLGANSVIEGKLSSKGNVRLDGQFSGTLEINGNVLVGETARIHADIDARNISIAGAVRGNVSGNKVQLLRTGRIWGDIKARALTTEEGAFIDGKITMTGHAAMQQAEEEQNPPEVVPVTSMMPDDITLAAATEDPTELEKLVDEVAEPAEDEAPSADDEERKSQD